MILSPFPNGQTLDKSGIEVWEQVTERFLEEYFSNVVEPSMMGVTVWTQVLNVRYPVADVNDATGSSRRLQQDDSKDPSTESLAIEFDLKIFYRSFADDYDLDQLVWSAFDSPRDKTIYVSRLQRRSEAFRPVQDVGVKLDGYEPPPTLAPTRIPTRAPTQAPKPEKADSAVIVGASLGSVAFVILIVLLFLRHRTSKTLDDNKVTETVVTPTTTGNVKVSTEILVEPQDDVSTLGDPTFGQGMMMGGIEKDEMTATVGDDYDYTKHYRNTRGAAPTNTRDRLASEEMSKMSSVQSISMSKLGKMEEHLFADDASFEEQFIDPEERLDVVAPPGKLGMVIDTPNGGTPIVHAIKETSVLVDQVRVGDRLLSVDGEDCTGMTAIQVSKLISLKSEKPARVLVFARSTNTNQEQ